MLGSRFSEPKSLRVRAVSWADCSAFRVFKFLVNSSGVDESGVSCVSCTLSYCLLPVGKVHSSEAQGPGTVENME